MTNLAFNPHVLFLSEDPAVVTRCLDGVSVRLAEARPLRADVSTDEITPLTILVHYDATLGRYPYTGFRAGSGSPIGVDAVRRTGIEVVVAGKRYGKGSSREHSPAAERHAGVRLVIAESFERIYRQNADNIGLFTTTDFGVLERIQAGEPVSLDALLSDRDPLTQAILRSGGLLRYMRRNLGAPARDALPDGAPRTYFGKVLERHLTTGSYAAADMPSAVDSAFVRADWRFIHEYYTGMVGDMLHATFGEGFVLHDPASIVVFEDHTSYADESPAHARNLPLLRRMVEAQRHFVTAHGLRCHRTLTEAEVAADGTPGDAGISHAMMAERYVLPGQLAIGTDSHTPHSGALGCVAFGVGATDMASAFMTGAVRLAMPGVLRVQLCGYLQPGVSAKDVALRLLADEHIRGGAAIGKVFEFSGSVIDAMNTDERATLTNMVAELGGFTGIVVPDAETVRFLRERRGITFCIEPWMTSDTGAHYDGQIELDCTTLGPMVAKPGDPGNGIALDTLPEPVVVDIAYGGSCTAGKQADFDRYHEVLRWAADRGLRVASHVQLYLQFGTTAVGKNCAQSGYLETFREVGARVLQPSCGACGNCGPGASHSAGQVTISAINRNFPGRGGPGKVWLGSPQTVAASAIAGELVSFAALRQRYAGVPLVMRGN